MKVCLVSRYFDANHKEGVGIGATSGKLLEYLPLKDVGRIGTKGTGLYSYFLYTMFEIPIRLPRNCKVYHALTPMEAIWLPKNKSIVTFHDLFQLTNPDKIGGGMGYNKKKRMIGIRYFEFACRVATKCKRIVCVSEKTKNEVIALLGVSERKTRVIRWGIDDSFGPEKRSDKIFRVGYLGMLDRRKRVNLLIDAFKNKNLIGGELFIGGTGLDENILKEQAAGANIQFLGHILQEDMKAFYNSLDLFVFPTVIEGYGLPIVEAMACKKPVVVLVDAEIPDEVKNRCIVVESLNGLFANEDYIRSQISSLDVESNYEWAKSHSWEKCVEQYLEVYSEVL